MQNKLPHGWVECEFEDLLQYIQPTKYIVNSTNYDDNYKTPVLTAGKSFILGYTNEVNDIFTDYPVIIFDDFTTATKYVDFPFKVKSSAMKILKPYKYVNLLFLYYLMQTIHHNAETHKRYWISEYAKRKIPFPPFNEQKRIVEKIESEFAKIDEGLEHLEKAKEQIKQYRQSVLKSAFEGKLTQQNPGDESAEALLQKINPKASFKHNDKLPQGWVECLIKDIAKNIQYGYTESANKDKIGPRFLRITDIQNNNVNWNLVPYCKIEGNIKSKYLLENGDFVFARTGATVGKSYLIENLKEESVYASYLIRIRFYDVCFTKYVKYYFQTSNYWNQISENKVGIGQPNVNGTVLSNLKIPFPPLQEQKQIVDEIEKRFAVADEVEKVVDDNIEKAKQLKQSILKKAFEGRLVPQDPTDEPASKLLEKIKQERKENDRK